MTDLSPGFVIARSGVYLSGLSLGLRRRRGGTTIEYEQEADKAMLFDSERVAQVFANVVTNATGEPHRPEPHTPTLEAPKPKKARKVKP